MLDLTNTNFMGAVLRQAVIDDVILRGANFSNADLSGATLQGFGFHHDRVVGALFTGANLTGAEFNYSANLTGIDLTGANVTGVYWDYTVTCPDGTLASSHSDPSSPSHYTCVGHLAP